MLGAVSAWPLEYSMANSVSNIVTDDISNHPPAINIEMVQITVEKHIGL